MYPNPQDVLPLPRHPDLEHYRKRAKELARACRDGEEAIGTFVSEWIDHLATLRPDLPGREGADLARRKVQVAQFARDRLGRADCALNQAQFVLARAHGFTSWSAMARHLESLAVDRSGIRTFERAADAIINSDLAVLGALLADDPALVHARSDREHRATLLHYVAANGVENYRQRTPANILDVTRMLLDAGALVDATADMYGIAATTFALVVTSAHPRAAGVQDDLADLLLEHGAVMPHGIVFYALANGCPEAAQHLARRGANVDFVEAAGIGALGEVVRRLEAGDLSRDEIGNGLVYAAWYGRREVVEAMLDHGVDIGSVGPEGGQTALHVAAYRGDVELVASLLGRGAPVDARDRVHGTPPLVWALHAWLAEGKGDGAAHRTIASRLLDAGARVEPDWLASDALRAEAALHARMSARAAER